MARLCVSCGLSVCLFVCQLGHLASLVVLTLQLGIPRPRRHLCADTLAKRVDTPVDDYDNVLVIMFYSSFCTSGVIFTF